MAETSSRRRTRWVAALLVLLVPSLLGASTAAAAPAAGEAVGPAQWPLLYTGGVDTFRLAPLDGDPVQQVPGQVFAPAVFSPAGDRLASGLFRCRVAQTPCPEGQLSSRVVVTEPDGTASQSAELPGSVQRLTWNGAGTEVAALVRPFSSSDLAIYRVPLDGQAPTLLVADSARLGLAYGAISWNPTSAQIAFAASEPTFGQLWSVSANGGSPRALTSPPPSGGATRVSFTEPDFSPDGTRLAVVSFLETDRFDNCTPETCEHAISTVEPGDTLPTKVAEIPIRFFGDGGYGIDYPVPPRWSADGGHLLFGMPVGRDREPRLVDLRTGTQTPGAVPEDEFLVWTDWQPCPGGTCVRWGETERPVLSMTYEARPRVVANLRVRPASVRRVAVVLDRKNAQGTWKRVARKVVSTSAAGRASVTFPAVSPGSCRLTATGVDQTRTARFRC